jgi:hypothetical protein
MNEVKVGQWWSYLDDHGGCYIKIVDKVFAPEEGWEAIDYTLEGERCNRNLTMYFDFNTKHPECYTLIKQPLCTMTAGAYKKLLVSGMFWELYPDATGIYLRDCKGAVPVDEDIEEGDLDNTPRVLADDLSDIFGDCSTKGEDIDYIFNEDVYLQEVKDYVDSTYSQHYAANRGKIQTTQLISKIPERGLIFCTTNIQKYADRFGIKAGHNRKDILKILHYGLMALSNLDEMNHEKDN